jgi:DNA helicase-2/ATP-dependent DNA helicase PcrA
VSSRRSAREPASLDQLPVWHQPAAGEAVPSDIDDSGLGSLLDGLNAEQRRAVTHGDGPLLVVAGAGTGKTQVITRRIAWLIAGKRARPSEILALTFTDKAAEEMQVRVDQLVPYGYTDAAISTFHAFGDRIIREFALELGLPTEPRVLSRPETVILLRERLFDFELDEYRPLGDPTRFLAALATLFSRCKDEDVSPAAYLAYAEELSRRAAEAASAAGEVASGQDRDAADTLREAAARAGPRVRALPGSPRQQRVRRLRRPGRARPAPPARIAERPGRAPGALPLHPRRRVPGHQPRPVGAGGPAGRAAPERDRRR